MRLFQRGLSLIEVTIVLTLISVMMALSLPMLSSANARARSELCQQNLVEIGQAIVSVTHESGRLPTLYNLAPEQTGQSLPELIEPLRLSPNIVFCPSDETEASQALGTSYRWGEAFNGQSPDAIQQVLGQRVLADREAYHPNAQQTINEMVVVQDDSGLHLSLVSEDPKLSTFANRSELYFIETSMKPEK